MSEPMAGCRPVLWLVALMLMGGKPLAAGQNESSKEVEKTKEEVNFETAVKLKMKGDAAGAIKGYQDALVHMPNSAKAYFNLAIALRHDNFDLKGAARGYHQTLHVNSSYAPAYNNLGNLLAAPDADEESFQTALHHYTQAMWIRPGDHVPMRSMATAMAARADSQPGNQTLLDMVVETVQLLHGGDELPYLALGTALVRGSNTTGALQAFSTARRIQPQWTQNCAILCSKCHAGARLERRRLLHAAMTAARLTATTPGAASVFLMARRVRHWQMDSVTDLTLRRAWPLGDTLRHNQQHSAVFYPEWLRVLSSQLAVREAVQEALETNGTIVHAGSAVGDPLLFGSLTFGLRSIGLEPRCSLAALGQQMQTQWGAWAPAAEVSCEEPADYQAFQEAHIVIFLPGSLADPLLISKVRQKLVKHLPELGIVVDYTDGLFPDITLKEDDGTAKAQIWEEDMDAYEAPVVEPLIPMWVRTSHRPVAKVVLHQKPRSEDLFY